VLGGVAFGLPAVLVALVHSSSLVQYVTIGAIVLAMGCVLGVPFPQGIHAIRTRNERLVPWAWGINGAASVVAINVVGLLLGSIPNSRFMLVGLGCYVVACALFAILIRPAIARDTA